MARMSGREAFLQILEDEGIGWIFGNPGTTELPIMDTLVAHPKLRYVLGLQESVAMAMADGYARASGEVVCANFHVAPGLGNAIGAIYNAAFFGSPVLVTAGQQPQGLGLTEPMLHSELPPLAAPVVKWATEVHRVADLPRVLRRAVKTALTPPTGPVFVSLPGDVLMEEAELALGRATRVRSDSQPSAEALQRLATRLLEAENPIIVACQEVHTHDCMHLLAQTAELLGAPVWTQSVPYVSVYPSAHALYMGELTRSQQRVRNILQPHDLLFMAGGDGLRMSVPSAVEPLPEGLPLVQVSDSGWELGKNYPAELALQAQLDTTLAALNPLLRAKRSQAQATRARTRTERLQRENWSAHRPALAEQARQAPVNGAMHPDALMLQVAEHMPPEGVVVEEGLTSTRNLQNLLSATHKHRIYGLASGGIGCGIAAAVGIKLAQPQRPLAAIIGDGSAMYSIQALWTAANQGLPIAFVIANNGGYSILKERLKALEGPAKAQNQLIAMDLNQPQLDFLHLAQGLGVRALRVETPADAGQALREALQAEGPTLIEARVQDLS